MTNDSFAIGADIGGTHITAALVDLDKKTILPGSLVRQKVDSHAPHSGVIDAWCQAIRDAGKEREFSKIGLAMPGPFDYEKGICLMKSQDKYENLYGLNIKELLAEKLQINPANITMLNDAPAFLLGEVFGGAAAGFEKAIGITLGTGLGTCVYKDHFSSNADLWKLPFRAGIAEDYLSTRWFIKRYSEMTGNKLSGVHELSVLAENMEAARLIFSEFGNNLAAFLEKFLTIAPSGVIIIGGNISKSYSWFKAPLLKSLQNKFPRIVIKTALLGEEAALVGAASYCKNEAGHYHHQPLNIII